MRKLSAERLITAEPLRLVLDRVMYRVISDFSDLSDGGYIYRAGDKYPRTGIANHARVVELSGRNNMRGAPLIELVERGHRPREKNAE